MLKLIKKLIKINKFGGSEWNYIYLKILLLEILIATETFVLGLKRKS